MKQPLKAKVNGLTVTSSQSLTVARTQGESSTAASAASVLLVEGQINRAMASLFTEFWRVYLSQEYRVKTHSLITVPPCNGFILE